MRGRRVILLLVLERVDVGEDQLHIEVDLPWLLQKLAEPVQAFLTRRGADMLRIGKS